MLLVQLACRSFVLRSVRGFAQNSVAMPLVNTEKTTSVINPMEHTDYFGVKDLVTIEDLFDARVHYGHKKGCRHHTAEPYLFGCRNDVDVINLDETHDHLIRAMNFLSHVVYAGGLVLFLMRSHIYGHMVERMAKDCGEFAHTRHFQRDVFLQHNPSNSAKLPDVCVFLSLMDNVNTQHVCVTACAKINIPTVGIADTNSDISMVTYPVPGNDDSLPSIELYCKLFKTCVLRAKRKRKEEKTLKKHKKEMTEKLDMQESVSYGSKESFINNANSDLPTVESDNKR